MVNFKTKEIFSIFFIISVLFFSFEIFSFYKLEKIKQQILDDSYIPLLKYSKISKKDLQIHFNNIVNLKLKNNELREYHPGLIYIYKPNLKSETFYTNSLGLLDEEPNFSKKQILLLGSSVVGSGLRQNFKENIDHFLEREINMKSVKKEYEVLNAGIGGYVSNQEFNLMHGLSSKINFEKLIYMSGANDIDARYRVKDFKNIRSYDIIHSTIIKTQIDDNILLRKNPLISIYIYFKKYFLPSLNSYKYLQELVYSKKINKIYPIDKVELEQKDIEFINEIVQNYVSNVKKMMFLAKSENTKLYVGLQPTLFTKNFKTDNEKKNIDILINKYGYKYMLYFKVAYPLMKSKLEFLKKEYPEYINLMNTDIIFDNTKIDIFRDNVHFLDYANEIVAKKISSYLN